MAEGVGFLLATALIAIFVTAFAAKLAVKRRPRASRGAQVLRALWAFPGLALALFAVATVWTIYGAPDPSGDTGVTGMVVFAFAFFLIYALVIGAIVGVPTAILAVRNARNR
ncbi:MAG: hypothetical protein EOP60_06125 [Sphingomonadales bacterium]|nr:MAG: hypothetical protein EOP60_06125 [Sphingomonadales bacterium]